MKFDMSALLAGLKPLEGQLAKYVWESVIHPILQKAEAGIPSDQLKGIAAVLDVELDKLAESEIAKL